MSPATHVQFSPGRSYQGEQPSRRRSSEGFRSTRAITPNICPRPNHSSLRPDVTAVSSSMVTGDPCARPHAFRACEKWISSEA